jgi:hypothetical protein
MTEHSRPKDGVATLAHSRPKDGVATLAYGPGHSRLCCKESKKAMPANY